MSSYSFKSANNMGPIQFGSTLSGGGTVVFGSNNPTLTASLANLTQNPLMLLGIGGLLLAGVWILSRSKHKLL